MRLDQDSGYPQRLNCLTKGASETIRQGQLIGVRDVVGRMRNVAAGLRMAPNAKTLAEERDLSGHVWTEVEDLLITVS